MEHKVKTLPMELKGNNNGKLGRIFGYASVFNVRDEQGDVIMPHAFQTSVKDPKDVKMLLHHKNDAVIGHWTRLTEDANGLYVEGEINLESDIGLEAFIMVEQGLCKSLSVGFQVLESSINLDTRYIKDVDLREISIVNFPANPMTMLDSIKESYRSEIDSACRTLNEALDSLKNATRSFLNW